MDWLQKEGKDEEICRTRCTAYFFFPPVRLLSSICGYWRCKMVFLPLFSNTRTGLLCVPRSEYLKIVIEQWFSVYVTTWFFFYLRTQDTFVRVRVACAKMANSRNTESEIGSAAR